MLCIIVIFLKKINRARAHTRTHARTHARTRTHTHIHTHTRTHARTHTHPYRHFSKTMYFHESYLGSMFEYGCKYCNAKHFSFEYTKDKQFSNCCHKGKVSSRENPPYPYKLENLSTGLSMDSINFRKNILVM